MQGKQQGCGQMAMMSVVVVLGKPCIFHSKPIGEMD